MIALSLAEIAEITHGRLNSASLPEGEAYLKPHHRGLDTGSETRGFHPREKNRARTSRQGICATLFYPKVQEP